jgi:nucleoid-associated protein YgaU
MGVVQFWFYGANKRLQLPVNPPVISVSSPFGYEDVAVAGLGEITVIGDRLPKEITFSSFFPRNYNSTFCEYTSIPKPADAVEFIEDLRDRRKPIRLTITGTNINYLVTIREFDTEPERAGNPGDIYFTMTLKEYTEITIRKMGEKKSSQSARPASTNTTASGTVYTVKAGDTLSKIALRFYKDASKYTKIYEANKATIGKNPNNVKAGQKLVIPK